MGKDGGGNPESEVVHPLHEPQDVVSPVLVLLFLPGLVEQLGWLDLGEEAEVNDGQLPSNFFWIKIKDA